MDILTYCNFTSQTALPTISATGTHQVVTHAVGPEKVPIINVLANATRHGASESIIIKPRTANVDPIHNRVGDLTSVAIVPERDLFRLRPLPDRGGQGPRKGIVVKKCFLHINPLPNRGGQCSRKAIFA